MKKFTSILLVLMLVLSMSTMAFADGTTTLTTTVPGATYTLNIPADQEIQYGVERTDIGNVSISNASGFAETKNIKVTINYSAFTSSTTDTTIPFSLMCMASDSYGHDLANGSTITFLGVVDGGVSSSPMLGEHTINSFFAYITSAAWGAALPGEYSTAITFTSEIVNG